MSLHTFLTIPVGKNVGLTSVSIGLVRTLDAIGCTAPTGVEVFHTRQDTMTLAEIARDWAQSTNALLARARSAA